MTRTFRRKRRGAIFVTAMWVVIVLAALVVVFARSMRVELIASSNTIAQIRTDALELGAEQYVLSQVDDTDGRADDILQLNGEALPIGTGYFWLLRPAANEQTYDFGITDEAGKVNLNTASEQQLVMLPGMTQQAADSIIDWRSPGETVTGLGAKSSYYSDLQEPYRCKDSPLESIEEALLVQGVTPNLMWGIDRNRNGAIEQAESASGQGSAMPNALGVVSDRGIFPFVTVYTMEPNTDSLGEARVNVNNSGQPSTGNQPAGGKSATPQAQPVVVQGGPGGPGGAPDNPALRKALQSAGLPAQRVNDVISRAARAGQSANLFDFAQKVSLSPAELRQVSDKLTTTDQKILQGLINVNTAPREVLLSLPGLEEADADALIAQRQRSDTSSIAWVAEALPMQKAAAIGSLITNRSYIYSADIVAVSGDARAFKRVRIVVDARNTPANIIYRKDLTQYGWPLPTEVRDALRAGRQPPTVGQAGGWQGFGTR